LQIRVNAKQLLACYFPTKNILLSFIGPFEITWCCDKNNSAIC